MRDLGILYVVCVCQCFFFNATPTTEIYTLSLHDALPIYPHEHVNAGRDHGGGVDEGGDRRRTFHRVRQPDAMEGDRKSTRLNSSHTVISYAVFCLKKKKKFNHNLVKNQFLYLPSLITHKI